MPHWMAITIARIRMPLIVLFLALVVGGPFVHVLPAGWWPWLALSVAFMVLGRLGTVRGEPMAVQPPVRGRWLAHNSPATRVPSHGIHAYGQGYAIDLVYDPPDGRRPRLSWWPLARRPEEFAGFGQPVLAPADGVVVRTHDRERDHRSRTSVLGLIYLFTIEQARELFGPSRVIGNHVVLDLGSGVYATCAHLRRHSVHVTVGQRVRAGDPLAECGNSGNTSEPHLHFQLMDHPSPALAAGLPFRFTGPDLPADLPRNGEHLTITGVPGRCAGSTGILDPDREPGARSPERAAARRNDRKAPDA